MENKIAFLLLSCDKYYDMIEPFAQLMTRFWSDCPYKKFAATNLKPFNQYGFNPILMGEDVSWSSGIRNAILKLKDLGYEYVLITLEDLFLCKKVNTSNVTRIVRDFTAVNGNYIRFYNHFAPQKRITNDFGEILPGQPYRQNCVYALWRIDTLVSILKDGENAWDFEKKAVVRGYDYPNFFAVYNSQFCILNTLIKGKWVPADFRKAKKLLPDLQRTRPMMSIYEELKLNTRRALFHLFFWVTPRRLQKKFIK